MQQANIVSFHCMNTTYVTKNYIQQAKVVSFHSIQATYLTKVTKIFTNINHEKEHLNQSFIEFYYIQVKRWNNLQKFKEFIILAREKVQKILKIYKNLDL